MTVADEFAYRMGKDDLTVDGLARLEHEVLRDHPEVQRTIQQIVTDFEPVAADIEQRHSGRTLMAPVSVRRAADWPTSAHPLLSFASFAIIALPAVALGISMRGGWGFAGNLTVVATLLGITAVLCLVKALSTLRNLVWTGMMLHWTLAAAFLAGVILFTQLYVAAQLPDHGADAQLATIAVSAAVIAGFAALSVARRIGAARRLQADLAPTQPAVSAFLGEFNPKYESALARIQDAIETIDPNERIRLKRERDNAVNFLVSKGLNQGQVPPLIHKKPLGEFALFAVAEPLAGGGSYPKRGKLTATRGISS